LWLLFSASSSVAQGSLSPALSLQFKETLSIPENTERTFVDHNNNLYFVAKDQIIRYSLATGIRSIQSQKIWQNIQQVLAINTMKTVVFSQVQQTLCFTDNTLSSQGTCMDLQEFNLNNVTVVASSKRPDMLWLYDELNSQLVLFNFVKRQILQNVVNLRGILNIEGEVRLEENHFGLWLFTSAGQVIRLDDYLNALTEQQLSYWSFLPYKNGGFMLRDKALYYETILEGEVMIQALPLSTPSTILHIAGNQLLIEHEKLLEVYNIVAN
jgi:hypothetical protein